MVLWLTGMSGAGKSTLANLVEVRIREYGARVTVLDGDVVRTNMSKGLGFTKEHRNENVRRLGQLCETLTSSGVIVIVAAISPYREARNAVRSQVKDFVEVHVDCALDVLIQRDTKGLYKKAIAGELANFTGISDPYEAPLAPEIVVNTAVETEEQSVERIWNVMRERLDHALFVEERTL